MNILFVDDDPLIILKLKAILPWKDLGFNKILIAHNGQEAFTEIEKEQPEIVISDINMPYMNGVELVETCLLKFPDIHFIMLTVNDSFSYAQRALNLGVFHYLLKPIEKSKLEEIISKVILSINNKNENVNYIHSLEKDSRISKLIQKEQFLNRLIAGENIFSREEILEHFQFHQILLKGPWFQLLSIHINNFEELRKDIHNLDDFLFNLKDEIQDILFQHDGISIFTDQFYNIILIKSFDNNSDLTSEAQLISQLIRTRLMQEHHLKVTIFISYKYQGENNIYRCYYDTRYFSEFPPEIANQGIISIPEVVFQKNVTQNKINNIRSDVLKFLRTNQKIQLNSYIIQTFSKIDNIKENLDTLVLIRTEFILTGIMFLHETKSSPEKIFGSSFSVLNFINKKSTLQNTNMELFHFYEQILNYVNDYKIPTNKLLIEKCFEIIDDNISNQMLTVKWLSEQLYINASHLSVQFKKETGITLIKYINQQKLKHAKNLMETGGHSLYSIAKQSGFNDQLYFSKCFKKEYGISPSLYLANLNS